MKDAVNNRIFGARTWRKAKAVLRHPKFHLGFRDYESGRPFDYGMLDGWPLIDQHRYENGREIAAECRFAGILVRWRERTCIPPELKELVAARVAARGGAGAMAVPRSPAPAGDATLPPSSIS